MLRKYRSNNENKGTNEEISQEKTFTGRILGNSRRDENPHFEFSRPNFASRNIS